METITSDDRLSAATFRALLESPAQGVVGVDSKGFICLVNQQAEELFGYDSGELLGSPVEVLVPARARSVHAEEMGEYSKNPRSRPMGLGVDLKGRRRDGSEFPVEISLNHLWVGGESIVLSLITDITERVQLEQHAQEARKMEALSQFAGGVAHELNQLLAAISEHFAVARGGYQGGPESSSSVEALSASAERIASLAKQLTAINGSCPADLQWFDLNRRLSEMRGRLTGLVGETIDLELGFAEDLGEVLADPLQIEQLILSLARNARDAMPDGGRLRILTSIANVGEASAGWHLPAGPGPHVLLTVTDTGVGMPAEVLEHLFEPFFTTKKTAQRKGLSLAAAYGVVRNAGGSISASSAPNLGTTVQVIIPRIGAKGD